MIFSESKPQKDLQHSDIYPYIISKDYPSPDSTSGIAYSIGHELKATLVRETGDLVTNISKQEIDEMKLSVNQAWLLAIENLKTKFRNGDINAAIFNGPRDKPFLLIGGHWLAASIILLPNLYEWAQQNFNTDTLCASIPHRAALLIFEKVDTGYLTDMIKMIKEKESNEPKQLSFGLFELTSNGISVLDLIK